MSWRKNKLTLNNSFFPHDRIYLSEVISFNSSSTKKFKSLEKNTLYETVLRPYLSVSAEKVL